MDESQTELAIALVGCGGIATAHLEAAARVGARIAVTAVIDPDPASRARFAERTGAPSYPSLDDAIDQAGHSFDAVDVMVPHDQHESIALTALQAGKHLLLEKPMATDVAACHRMLAAAEAAPEVVFLVAEQSQYWPDVIEARRLIDQGAIGRPLFGRACYWDPGVLVRDLGPDDEVPWRYRLELAGGGLAVDGGAHWIRPLRMLLGEVDEVVAVTGRHVDRMEGESWLQAMLRFQTGVTASFEAFASTAPMAPVELFRITGTDGELVIPGPDFVDAELRLHNADHPRGETVLAIPRGRADSYGHGLADFARAVLDGTDPAATAEHSIGELRTALAIYRSARTRRWEPVWGEPDR